MRLTNGILDGLLWPHRLDGEVTEAVWRTYPLLGTAGTLSLIGALVLAVLWVYHRSAATTRRSRRSVLLVLRLAAVACLVPALLDLSLHLELRRRVQPVLAVAIDASQSMSLADRYVSKEQKRHLAAAIGTATTRPEDESRLARIDLARRMLTSGERLKRLAQAELRVFSLDRSAQPVEAATPVAAIESIQADGQYTSLVGGIDEIVDRLRGQPAGGILLLSDGANNAGGSPLTGCERWKTAGVPVHTVAVGDPDPKDIELRQVLADDLLFVGEPSTIIARLRHRGYGQRKLPLLLKQGEDVLARAEVELDAQQVEINVPLTFKPPKAGEQTFRVECPPQPDEAVEQNNQKSFVARVTADKIRVLYLEGTPRWQYRFLRDAMARDRRVALQALLAGGEPVPDPAPPMIAAPPTSKSAYESCDVIILGDVDPSVMTTEQMEWIREVVRDDGVGLLLLAGPTANPRAYMDLPLAELFPVESAEGPGSPAQRPRATEEDRFLPQLTPVGRTHPSIQLGDDAVQNAEIWESLATVFWSAPVKKARPGASVLAVHPREMAAGSSAESLPVLAVQQFGKGRSFYCGIDETWRWRLKRGDRIFYRLWSQVLQYLGSPHMSGSQSGMTIRTDRLIYGQGETALISVRAEEMTVGDLPPVVAEGPDGTQTRLTLSPSPGAQRLFETRMPLNAPGTYKLWVDRHLLEASTTFEVETARLELQEPAANAELMRQIAEGTGGRFARPEEFDRLLGEMDLSPRTVQERRTVELWDLPVLVGLFVSLLGVEWILRRLWQLP
jgi:hypothetical protein